MCRASDHVYHVDSNPPAVDGVCDIDGSELYQREDDQPDVIRTRFQKQWVEAAAPDAMVVHGIPGPYALAQGDLLSIDVGVTLDGYVADSAITFTIGEPSQQAADLIAACYEGLDAAIAQCHAGNRLGDVSHAVQTAVEARGFGVVRSLVGHGVGRNMHEDP